MLRVSGFTRLLLRDSALAAAAGVISRLAIFGLSVWVSRRLGSQAEFGVFSSVVMAVQLSAMIAGLGLAQTAARSIALFEDDAERYRIARTMFLVLSAVSVIGGAAVYLAVPFVLPGDLQQGVPYLASVTALLVFLQVLVGGVEGIVRGLKRFWLLPIAVTLAALAGLLLAIYSAREVSVLTGLSSLGLFLLVQSAVLACAFKGGFKGRLMPLQALVGMGTRVAAPTFVSGLSWNLAMMLPPFFLTSSSFGLPHLAAWNATVQLRALIGFVPVVVVNAVIPHLVAVFRDRRQSRTTLLPALAMPILPALVTYLPAVVFANEIMSLYGASYGEHSQLLVLTSSLILLQVLGTALFGLIIATGEVWGAALVNMAWSVVVIGSSPVVVDIDGAYSLALLHLVSYVPVVGALACLAFRGAKRAQLILRAVPEIA